ncbi:hypothetical protein ASE38_06385 [Cellulomonas sp. Root930]|nr:hypothetical protein ASE38_06385 [Cellulomonas sp. Root930]
MDTSAAVTVVVGLVGVVVGAWLSHRFSVRAQREAWRRERRYELYVEAVPVLQRARTEALREVPPDTSVVGDLRFLLLRVKVLGSPDAVARVAAVDRLLSNSAPPWYLTSEQREQYRRPLPLGHRTATRGVVDEALAALERDVLGVRAPEAPPVRADE